MNGNSISAIDDAGAGPTSRRRQIVDADVARTRDPQLNRHIVAVALLSMIVNLFRLSH